MSPEMHPGHHVGVSSPQKISWVFGGCLLSVAATQKSATFSLLPLALTALPPHHALCWVPLHSWPLVCGGDRGTRSRDAIFQLCPQGTRTASLCCGIFQGLYTCISFLHTHSLKEKPFSPEDPRVGPKVLSESQSDGIYYSFSKSTLYFFPSFQL